MVYHRYSHLFYIAQSPRTELSLQKYSHCFTHHGNRESRNIPRHQPLEIRRRSLQNGSHRSYSRYCGHYLFWNRIIMLFALGTTNTPKTNALRDALSVCPYFQGHEINITGFKVASWVPEMPLTLLELREGAKNRAQEVRRLCPEANFFIGMEWGVYHDTIGTESWLMGVVYIEDRASEGHFAYTCHMPVPPAVVLWLHDGSWRDLDQIVESLGAPPDTGDTHGSFGLWSDLMLPRSDQLRLAVQSAISPFFNDFYTK